MQYHAIIEERKKINKTAIRPALIYSWDCWWLAHVQKVILVGMMVLRRMSDNTRKDMIKNKCICQKLEVAPTLMKDNVGWFGCVQWRSMHEWYGWIIWSKLKVLKSLEGVEIKCGLYPSFSVRYLLFACTCYWPTKK